jgi:hypothetical protein
MNPEQEFQELYERMYLLCQENGWGDPFSYARSREIYMANALGHKVATTYSGADAYEVVDGHRVPVEYKSTICDKINATYNGISVQDTWEDQEKYIKEEKIGKYPYHYYARFSDGEIVEVWKLESSKVLDILLPKIKKQYPNKKKGNSKDPRIGVTISTKQIKKNGERIR